MNTKIIVVYHFFSVIHAGQHEHERKRKGVPNQKEPTRGEYVFSFLFLLHEYTVGIHIFRIRREGRVKR